MEYSLSFPCSGQFYYLLGGTIHLRHLPCCPLCPTHIQLIPSMETTVRVRPRVSTLKKCMGWYPGAYNYSTHVPAPPPPQESRFVTDGGDPDWFPFTSPSFTALSSSLGRFENATLESKTLMTGILLALLVVLITSRSSTPAHHREYPSIVR
jgi:hypothetical protein